MRFLKALGVAAVLGSLFTYVRGECLDCARNFTPNNGRHGAAADGRRIIKIKINSTLEDTPGHTQNEAWNAVRDAVNSWNNTTDQYANKTGYYFELDQSEPDPDIVVTKGAPGICPSGSIACILSDDDNHPSNSTIFLTDMVMNDHYAAGDWDRAGVVAHEIGHMVGLTMYNCGASVMNGVYAVFDAQGLLHWSKVGTPPAIVTPKMCSRRTRR